MSVGLTVTVCFTHASQSTREQWIKMWVSGEGGLWSLWMLNIFGDLEIHSIRYTLSHSILQDIWQFMGITREEFKKGRISLMYNKLSIYNKSAIHIYKLWNDIDKENVKQKQRILFTLQWSQSSSVCLLLEHRDLTPTTMEKIITEIKQLTTNLRNYLLYKEKGM